MLINLRSCDTLLSYYSTKWKQKQLLNPKKLFLHVYTSRLSILIFFKKQLYSLLDDFKKGRVVKYIMKKINQNILVCSTVQMIQAIAEEKRINAIGFVKGGRQLLDEQEHIFVENLVDVLSPEQKLELLQKKYFNN